jgi:hypothetical protein
VFYLTIKNFAISFYNVGELKFPCRSVALLHCTDQFVDTRTEIEHGNSKQSLFMYTKKAGLLMF